ncbi:MAG TPA: tetratricopeptide repeat protein [Vicinamibacterales bacterium]|jgi:tetratricopeptide (TPR) repeat protein
MRLPVALAVLMLALVTSPAHAQKLADEQSRRQALALYRTGQEFMSSEMFEKAIESFTGAIDRDPLLTVAHYQLGQAHMSLKRPASALQAYKSCLDAMEALHHLEESNRFEVDKQRQEVVRELRTELNQTSQKIDPLKRTVLEQRVQELEHERTSSSSGPFRPPAFVLLAMGSAHFRNGDRDTAEAEWRAAVEANPKLGEAHNNLAVIYMQSGRKAEAENAVKLAEKAGFKVNAQLKEDIKKLPTP